MPDTFSSHADSTQAPARQIAAIIPDDAADLPQTPKAIYVGTGGDLALVAIGAPAGAAPMVFRNLPSGALLPVRARRVHATGTDAADLLALL